MARKRNKLRHRLVWTLPLALIAAQSLAAGSTWVAGVRIPKNYRAVKVERIASGVWHLELRRRDREQVIHIAKLERSSPHRMRLVLSNNLVAGPEPRTERTSHMCRRVDCLLAVNGDYFAGGIPVGGLVISGEPMRSPHPLRKQFSLAADGSPSIGPMTMATTLVTSHRRVRAGLQLLGPGVVFDQQTTTLDGVNIPRPPDGIVVFTPRWGSSTGTKTGFEIVARVVSPTGPVRTGVDTAVDLVAARAHDAAIPKDAVVLSGRGAGADALAELWNQVSNGAAERRATLRVAASPGVAQSVAGNELLVHDGEIAWKYRTSRAPRTIIGWNAAGDILLVTADGRQPGRAYGFTLLEAADFMRRLGAVEALNLDGGGSTTFVRKGKVVNRPSSSGGSERRVAVAVTIVPAA